MLASRQKGRGFEPHRRHCVVSLSKNINPSLVLVQPRKTCPYITERSLMGRKESNQTNKSKTYLSFKTQPIYCVFRSCRHHSTSTESHTLEKNNVRDCSRGVLYSRVKSGKFGHQVNSDTHLQTVEIQMRRLLMSRLIRIFTVCFVNLFFIPITEL